ncbi:RNA polymerase sigma factor [Nonomuraea wenchangensis]|uniref:RNA polymerase sigma factor n=1 Tax=Nonomuraea wenchangensis TaxID=568860 RepID=UPI0033216CCD
MNDRNLVEALRARDPGAPAVLYDAYAEGVYRYCRSLLRDADAAQVALRDALIAAEAHADALAEPARLRSWLYALARAECLRRRTAALRPVTPTSSDQPAADPPAADSPAADPPAAGWPDAGWPDAQWAPEAEWPDAEWASDEPPDVPGDTRQRVMAWDAVHSLPSADRELLELTILHELPDSELALVLGVSARQLASAREAALGRLRDAVTVELLARQEPGECPRRAAILRGFSGRLTTERRERLVQHLSECAICAPRRGRQVAAAKVFELLPRPELPDALRLRVLSCFADPELAPYRRYVARRTSRLGVAGFPLPQKKAARRWPRALACLLAAVGAVVAIAIVLQGLGRDGIVSDVATAAFPPSGRPPAVHLPWQERPQDEPVTVEPVANATDIRRDLPAPAPVDFVNGVTRSTPSGHPPVGGDPAEPQAGPPDPRPGGPSAEPSVPIDPAATHDPGEPRGPGRSHGPRGPRPGSSALPSYHGRPERPCQGRFRPHCLPPKPTPTVTAAPTPTPPQTQEPTTPPATQPPASPPAPPTPPAPTATAEETPASTS